MNEESGRKDRGPDVSAGVVDQPSVAEHPVGPVLVLEAESRLLLAALLRDAEVVALYHQATMLRDPPSDPVRSRLAEEAYRRVIELDPEFAGGYAGLAYVLAFRSWWGLSEQPEIDARQALHSARLAVEKDPEFGWAQMSLAIALNVVGDHDGAMSAARLPWDDIPDLGAVDALDRRFPLLISPNPGRFSPQDN